MSFLSEMKDQLVASSVGTFGTTIFIGSSAIIPIGDGPYLSLIETGGTGAVRSQNGTPLEQPSAQLSARAKQPLAARTMLIAAYTALGGANGLHNVTLSGVWYVSLTFRQSSPTDVGLDDAGRALLVINVDAEKAPS